MKPKSLKELLDEHATLERDSLPIIDQISEMAKRAVPLQIEIFQRRFKKDMPGVKQLEAVHLCTFAAKEKPNKFDQLLAALTEKKVTVTQVIYDPMTMQFHLFGKAEL